MTYQDPDPRNPRNLPGEERLQVDPMLREGRNRWGWGIAIAATLFIVVILFATNRQTSNVADAPTAAPPASTTGAGPMPPATTPDSARANADTPPAKPGTAEPAERSTTGQAPPAQPGANR